MKIFKNIFGVYQDDGNLSHFAEFSSQPKSVNAKVQFLQKKVDLLYEDIRLGVNRIENEIARAFGAKKKERLLKDKTIDEDFSEQEQQFEIARQKMLELNTFDDLDSLKKLIKPQFNYL